MDILKKQIIERIDSLIRENNLNAAEFAKKIGKRPGIVTDWRTGRSFPSLEVLLEICTALNCNFYDIVPISDLSDNQIIDPDNISVKNGTPEYDLLLFYRSLNPDDQNELMMIAEMKYRKVKKQEDAKSFLSGNEKLA